MLTLRGTKGSELTHQEMDNNLSFLDGKASQAKTDAEAAVASALDAAEAAQVADDKASQALLQGLTQSSADSRYVRKVNGVEPDASGNVVVPVPDVNSPEFVTAVRDALGQIDFAPQLPAVSVSTPADFFVSGNVLAGASTVTGVLKVLNYSVPTVSVPSGITYTAGVSSTTNPIGTFKMNSDGSWTLTPRLYTAGVQSAIKYTVTNGLTTSTGTLVFNLIWHNHAPVTNPDNVSVLQDTQVVLNVLANDVEWDGQGMLVTHIAGQPVTAGGPSVPVPNGTASLAANSATITFVPTTGFTGLVTFNYTVTDTYAGASGPLASIGVVNILVSNTSNLATSNYILDTSLVPFDFAANPVSKNGVVYEPTTGATIRRLTDVTQDLPGNVALYNAYSRFPTENVTGEYQLAFAGNSYQCLVIDRASGAVVSSLSYDEFNLPSHGIGAAHEIRWHYLLDHPYRVYYVKGAQFWMIDDVRDQNSTRTMIKDFGSVVDWGTTPNNARQIYMDQEGNSSLDSDHWAWMATYYDPTMGGSGSNRVRAFVHYQISTDTVDLMYPADMVGFAMVPANETTLQGYSYRPNMVEMAPDGSGVLIHFDRAYPGHNDGYVTTCFEAPYLWPRDFKPSTFQPFRLGSDSTHSGWSTVDGNWYYVAHDNRRDKWSAVPIFGANRGYGNEGNLDVNLSLGPRVIDFHTDVAPYAGNHFGLCTNAADGWALVSTYSTQAADTLWFGNAIFLIKIVPEAQTFKWHVAPTCNQYFSGVKADYNEAPASINLAGTRVYTCGDWNGTSDHAPNGERYCDLYSIDLPANWRDHFLPVAPSNTTAPSIAGSAMQGATLLRTPGVWAGFPPPTVTGKWQKDGVDISGATGASYVVQASDVGSSIRFKETGTNASGSATAYSSAIGPIATVPVPACTSLPTITGTAQEGAELFGSDGTWTNTPTGFLRQWYRGTNPISGATGTSYTLGQADIGFQIRYGVTGTNSYGAGTEALSAQTSSVAADPGATLRVSAVKSTDSNPGNNTAARSAAAFDAVAGALIVVSVDWGTSWGANTGVTVSDTAGNTYTAGEVVAHPGQNSRCQQFWCLSSNAATGNVVTATNASPSTPLNLSVVQYTSTFGSSWSRTGGASAATDYVANPVTTSAFDMPAQSVAVGHWFDVYGTGGGAINTTDVVVHTVQDTSWTQESVRGQAGTNLTMTSAAALNSYTRVAASVQVFART